MKKYFYTFLTKGTDMQKLFSLRMLMILGLSLSAAQPMMGMEKKEKKVAFTLNSKPKDLFFVMKKESLQTILSEASKRISNATNNSKIKALTRLLQQTSADVTDENGNYWFTKEGTTEKIILEAYNVGRQQSEKLLKFNDSSMGIETVEGEDEENREIREWNEKLEKWKQHQSSTSQGSEQPKKEEKKEEDKPSTLKGLSEEFKQKFVLEGRAMGMGLSELSNEDWEELDALVKKTKGTEQQQKEAFQIKQALLENDQKYIALVEKFEQGQQIEQDVFKQFEAWHKAAQKIDPNNQFVLRVTKQSQLNQEKKEEKRLREEEEERKRVELEKKKREEEEKERKRLEEEERNRQEQEKLKKQYAQSEYSSLAKKVQEEFIAKGIQVPQDLCKKLQAAQSNTDSFLEGSQATEAGNYLQTIDDLDAKYVLTSDSEAQRALNKVRSAYETVRDTTGKKVEEIDDLATTHKNDLDLIKEAALYYSADPNNAATKFINSEIPSMKLALGQRLEKEALKKKQDEELQKENLKLQNNEQVAKEKQKAEEEALNLKHQLEQLQLQVTQLEQAKKEALERAENSGLAETNALDELSQIKLKEQKLLLQVKDLGEKLTAASTNVMENPMVKDAVEKLSQQITDLQNRIGNDAQGSETGLNLEIAKLKKQIDAEQQNVLNEQQKFADSQGWKAWAKDGRTLKATGGVGAVVLYTKYAAPALLERAKGAKKDGMLKKIGLLAGFDGETWKSIPGGIMGRFKQLFAKGNKADKASKPNVTKKRNAKK